ncbi:MAG TPA: hypothetical protein VF815_12670 [Myxococcaceae bacterium]|jgi:hypothetical protein
MIRQLSSFTFLLLSLLLTLAGCGDGVVGPDHPGKPLLTLEGQMNAEPGASVPTQVRLAFVWYPQWLAAENIASEQSTLQEIITEDLVYQGSFPANYRFHLYRPPPDEALAELSEGLQGKGAFGILLAYEDKNGNGKLDPIAMEGTPVDRVIGSSLLGSARSAFAVIYVNQEQPAATGLKPGFNIIQAVNSDTSAVVPHSTPLPLNLTSGGPLFDALVCEAGWLTFLFLDVCGLDGGEIIEPTLLGVEGRVALEGTQAVVDLRVSLDNAPRQDASVTLAGRILEYNREREAYALTERDSALLTPGGSFELVVSLGEDTLRRTFRMPGSFEITAPSSNAQVSRGQNLTLQWTASQGATSYYVGFDAATAGESIEAAEGALSHSFETHNASGPATASVEARTSPTEIEAWVTTALVREHAFTFAP